MKSHDHPAHSRSLPKTPSKGFKEYNLGLVHLGIKHLPKLQTADSQRRKRYPIVPLGPEEAMAAFLERYRELKP